MKYLLILVVLLTGCAQNMVEETWDGAKYTSKVKQNLFLYYTSTKEIAHQTPLSATTVGNIEAWPDPNSVEAVTKGMVEGIKTF